MTLPIDPAILDSMIEALAGAFPGGSVKAQREAAHAGMAALEPHDLIETMLATRMIAAHHATMDGYQRAMQPGVSDAEAVRLRNSAIAAARSFDAALRALEKRRQAPTEAPSKPHMNAEQPPTIAAAPVPHRARHVPRDKHGNAIAFWRSEDMTMAQRRASYGDPDDGELRAVALAEEAAMIEAEQRAAGARQEPYAPPGLTEKLPQ
jgi:hypothetical protein